MNGYIINAIDSDIKRFFEIFHEVINYKVEKITITYKNRLGAEFDLFNRLFQ